MRDRLHPRASELIACGAIAAFGIAGIVIAMDYEFGSIQRMGPGFFPIAICVAIVLLAALTAAETLTQPAREPTTSWRPLIFISLAVLAWAVLIDDLGLVPATVAMTLMAALAKPPFQPLALLLLCAGMCMAGYLIFIVGLGMPLTLLGR